MVLASAGDAKVIAAAAAMSVSFDLVVKCFFMSHLLLTLSPRLWGPSRPQRLAALLISLSSESAGLLRLGSSRLRVRSDGVCDCAARLMRHRSQRSGSQCLATPILTRSAAIAPNYGITSVQKSS